MYYRDLLAVIRKEQWQMIKLEVKMLSWKWMSQSLVNENTIEVTMVKGYKLLVVEKEQGCLWKLLKKDQQR
jgi:hypothetical protein